MASLRLLLMHVTTSSGHHQASQAIAHAVRRLEPDAHTISVDAFSYTSRFVRGAILHAYLSLIRYQPDVWEYLYDNPVIHRRVHHLRALLHRYHAKKLQRLLETAQPHAIACTQAFPCGMVADFKRLHGLRVPLVGVLTDHAPHLYWLHEQVDVYVVPSEEIRQKFISLGVPPERLRVLGIPIDPAFLDPVDRDAAVRQFGLDPRLPVILVMGGGSGFGPIRQLMSSLDRVPLPCQFVVLAGTNRALLAWLRAQPFRHLVVAQGHTDAVPALMELATLIITKPGGLTTSEALAKRRPLLVITPIPGQELCNARYLLGQGAAVQLGAPETAVDVVTQLLQDAPHLERLQARAGQLGKPDAAFRIAELLRALGGGQPLADAVSASESPVLSGAGIEG